MIPLRHNEPPHVDQLQMVRVGHIIGKGVDLDPVRQVEDYYLASGEFVFRVDSWRDRNGGRET